MKEDIVFNKMIMIAKRYSQALFELAKDDEELKSFLANLNTIQATINQNIDLKTFLSHPVFDIETKKEVIKEIFEAEIDKNILNFLFVLIDRNRVYALDAIVNHFDCLIDTKYNLLTVEVVTAIELTDEIKNKLIDKLQNIYNKQIKIKTKIDEDILAGMMLKIGDKVIDGSIKAKLNKMKSTLIQR